MSKRPELGDAVLDEDHERPRVDDLFALMEDVLAHRRRFTYVPEQVTSWRPEDPAGHTLMYRHQASGELIWPDEYRNKRDECEKELHVLERAMVSLAEAARERAQALFLKFRADVPPDGAYSPLAPGAFAANRGGGSEDKDDCWERLVTWGERCRDATNDRDRDIASGVCNNVLRVFQEKYGAFEGPVPTAEQLKEAFTPATDTERPRGPNSIAVATCELVKQLSKTQGLEEKLSKDTILRAVKRSNERHNTVYEYDEKGQIASSRVLDQEDWLGWTVQEERMSIEYRPMRFRSWDGAPELQVPEDWDDDSRGTAELLRHRRENYRWEGPTSKLVRIDQRSESERG